MEYTIRIFDVRQFFPNWQNSWLHFEFYLNWNINNNSTKIYINIHIYDIRSSYWSFGFSLSPSLCRTLFTKLLKLWTKEIHGNRSCKVRGDKAIKKNCAIHAQCTLHRQFFLSFTFVTSFPVHPLFATCIPNVLQFTYFFLFLLNDSCISNRRDSKSHFIWCDFCFFIHYLYVGRLFFFVSFLVIAIFPTRALWAAIFSLLSIWNFFRANLFKRNTHAYLFLKMHCYVATMGQIKRKF